MALFLCVHHAKLFFGAVEKNKAESNDKELVQQLKPNRHTRKLIRYFDFVSTIGFTHIIWILRLGLSVYISMINYLGLTI